MMRLSDIVAGPWAITPAMYAEVQGIYERHMRGEKIDLGDLQARTGVALNNQRADLRIENGVAVIEMTGVLARRMNLFAQISGGTSTQIVANQLRQAADDPGVTAIVLLIDSPGGTVDGTQELADVVANISKPVISLAEGCMCSAAYWVGSAARQVFISSDTTDVGSIGVVATHVDVSKAEEARGMKTTEITAGRFKRIASQYGPLTESGREAIQERVDQLYSVFVESVSRNRGTDVETVLKNMADGRVFIGRSAISAGLVDGVSTLDQLIARAAAGEFADDEMADRDGASSTADVSTQEIHMLTIEKVRADAPDVAKALHEEGFTAGKAEGFIAGKTDGAAAERERIQSVLSLAPKARGSEKLLNEMAYDGKTSAAEAALRILNAQEQSRTDRVRDLEADAGEVVTTSAAAPEGQERPAEESAHDIAARASTYISEQAKLGVHVDAATAVAHVTKGK